MKIEIKGRHKNALFHREEISFDVIGGKASREDVRKVLAAQLGTEENHLIVSDIDHGFGSTMVRGFAKKYDSLEDLKRIEPHYQIKRNKINDGKNTEETKTNSVKNEGTETNTQEGKS
ncbi:MAG: 30S ribosomal protein S24e [Candidatus Diapherotrites archaeon]